MRQRLLIAGLSAVLFLSGWGGVFASAMCRPTDASDTTADAQEAHACCRTDAKESIGSSSSSHCPLSAAASEQSAHADASADRETAASSVTGARFANLSPDACGHCFVRSENPPARFARPDPHARKRAEARPVTRLSALSDAPLPVSDVPVKFSRGASPPGASPPRHVLHGVFLI